MALPATATLPVSTAEAAGLRSPSLSLSSQAIAVARLAARAADDRQRIAAFMIRLAGVSSDVYPPHCVVADQLFELLPKVLVDNRLP